MRDQNWSAPKRDSWKTSCIHQPKATPKKSGGRKTWQSQYTHCRWGDTFLSGHLSFFKLAYKVLGIIIVFSSRICLGVSSPTQPPTCLLSSSHVSSCNPHFAHTHHPPSSILVSFSVLDKIPKQMQLKEETKGFSLGSPFTGHRCRTVTEDWGT